MVMIVEGVRSNICCTQQEQKTHPWSDNCIQKENIVKEILQQGKSLAA